MFRLETPGKCRHQRVSQAVQKKPRNVKKKRKDLPQARRAAKLSSCRSILCLLSIFISLCSTCVSTYPNIFKFFAKFPRTWQRVCVWCAPAASYQIIWASSLWFTSFQHLSRVQRLRAVKHRWQTLDLLTHFLHHNKTEMIKNKRGYYEFTMWDIKKKKYWTFSKIKTTLSDIYISTKNNFLLHVISVWMHFNIKHFTFTFDWRCFINKNVLT